MRFVAAISQGFRTCLKPNAILLQQKFHRVAATKIACVNGPLGGHDGATCAAKQLELDYVYHLALHLGNQILIKPVCHVRPY